MLTQNRIQNQSDYLLTVLTRDGALLIGEFMKLMKLIGLIMFPLGLLESEATNEKPRLRHSVGG